MITYSAFADVSLLSLAYLHDESWNMRPDEVIRFSRVIFFSNMRVKR